MMKKLIILLLVAFTAQAQVVPGMGKNIGKLGYSGNGGGLGGSTLRGGGGEDAWWEIDDLGVPPAFSSLTPGTICLGSDARIVLGSDDVVYEFLPFEICNGYSPLDPSGGNLTPVFWTTQSTPSAWDGSSYSAGAAVEHGGSYYFTSVSVGSTDIPGVSPNWGLIPAWDNSDDYTAGVSWALNQAENVFYKCAITSGVSSDFGAQDPESPTAFWQVYQWQIWHVGTTYSTNDLALKEDFSAWYHSLHDSNTGNAIP